MSNIVQGFQSNISSLIGQLAYSRGTRSFTTLISNMSTGIRIETGRDDPSGFISSSTLGREIANSTQAIYNCQRSNEMLSIVDSSLNQINTMLIDLRGYVTQAANTAVESTEMIDSLQLQADAALDTIDRIANSTMFQGQKLLDGTLDFTTYGVDRNQIANLNIYSANFNGATEKDISVKVLETAAQAKLYYQYGAALTSVTLQLSGVNGAHVYSFDKGADIASMAQAINLFSDSTGVAAKVNSEATVGLIGLSSAGVDNDIILAASRAGTAQGNFVVRYTAPADGNDTLSLNYRKGVGTEPNEIEIVLETQKFTSAVFEAENSNDGIANNEFQLLTKMGGSQFNDTVFNLLDVSGTGESTGIKYDFSTSPKSISISLDNTSVNELESWIKADSLLSTYFQLEHTNRSDGSGVIVPNQGISLKTAGLDGGAVLSTALDVATLLNTSPLLKDENGDAIVSAAIPSGELGHGIVSPFTEFAYYGEIAAQNAIQFLGPVDSPNIRFVSSPSTELSIEDTTFPAQYGRAETTIQGLESGTSFTLRAKSPGDSFDGMSIIFQDAQSESAVIDYSKNAVVFAIDFSGRAADSAREAFNMTDLQNLIEKDPFLSAAFELHPLSAIDPSNPAEFSHPDYVGINATMAQLSGGLVSPATLVVHLETDSTGAIRTTANDLVNFLDNQYNTGVQELIKKYGISASIMNLPNAALSNCFLDPSLNGFGILQPTNDLDACTGISGEGPYQEIMFTSFGLGSVDDYSSVTIESQNGMNASFVVTALQKGADFDGTYIRVVSDPNGPSVNYNKESKSLQIGVNPDNPSTANDVIALINSDPTTRDIFQAARTTFSDGTSAVALGDQGAMSGGTRLVSQFAETVTTARNGLDAVFAVKAKQIDSNLSGTSVRIVRDNNGPSVVYDTLTKELAIGIPSAGQPLTAKEIVDLINATPNVSHLFEASIPERIPGTLLMPDGSGVVSVGDVGTMSILDTGTPKGAPMTNNSDSQATGLTIYSVDYGSAAFVSAIPLNNSSFQTQDQFGNLSERQIGRDVSALINGELSTGLGSVASVRTVDLDIEITIDPAAAKGSVFGFRITGGGALMQIGPNANSLEQARLGLFDMNTAKLGDENGYLAQIRSGGEYNLSADTKKAFQIVESVILQVSTFRGRVGSFQKTQLDMSISQMQDLSTIATNARSDIRDTDFAAASSDLSRIQILMEANVSVLKKNSDNERMILTLLQG